MVVEILCVPSLLTLLSQDAEKELMQGLYFFFLKTKVAGLILFITVQVISLSESEVNLEEGRVSLGS